MNSGTVRIATAPLTSLAVFLTAVVGLAPTVDAQTIPDLVSRTAFRVCGDPSNLPFSDRKKEGFENKIAAILADQLKRPIRYFWAPSGPGFLTNTLNQDLCDVVMGYTIGAELVQATNPYYRSTYVLVAPKGSALNGATSMDDPRLKGHKIGVFSATPPTDAMLANGLLSHAKLYPLLVDHRFDSPLAAMLDDLGSHSIDAAAVWGPLIGDAVKQSNGALVMTPLLKDVDRPGFSYRIALGVRHDENDWKHELERALRARKADIIRVLEDYNVPMIDNLGHLVRPNPAVNGSLSVEPASTNPVGGPETRPAPHPHAFHMPGPAPSNP